MIWSAASANVFSGSFDTINQKNHLRTLRYRWAGSLSSARQYSYRTPSICIRYAETIAIAKARRSCLSEAASPYRRVGFLNGFRGYLNIGKVEELVLEGDGLAIEKSATIPRVSLVRAPRSLKGTPKLSNSSSL